MSTMSSRDGTQIFYRDLLAFIEREEVKTGA